MSASLTHSDVQELGDSFLHEFDARFSSISRDLYAPFTQEARQLEASVTTMYKIVAKLARVEEDLDQGAALWGKMIFFCDEASDRILKLSNEHPDCGAAQYLDRIS